MEPNLPQAHRDAGLSFSGVNGLNHDLLRPFPGYGSMRFRSFDSKASYNSLQVALQRRFSGSLTFGLSYTLSRAKTDSAGTTDATHPFDKNSYDYALANFDRTHYFVANYVWNVPKGGGLLAAGVWPTPCWTIGPSRASRGSPRATRSSWASTSRVSTRPSASSARTPAATPAACSRA